MLAARRSVVAAGNSSQSGTGWGSGNVGSAVTPFFSETFAGGAFNNANGFTWNTINANVAITTENPRTGSHSLCVTYGPDALDSNGNQASSEQRFNLGRDLSELWFEFYAYVPSNYTHRENATVSSNNKWFTLWRDNYDPAVDKSFFLDCENELGRYDSVNPSGGSRMRLAVSRQSDSVVTDNGGPHFGSLTNLYKATLGGTNGPAAVSTWVQFRYHIRTSSADGVSDGSFREWINGTLNNSVVNANFSNGTGNALSGRVFRNGYLMGASNSGYTAQTKFFVDDVSFYDSNPGW